MIINDYLKKEKVSKYRLAKECGLPYGTLNDICNGKTDIAKCTGETLMKISSAVGCTVDSLLYERLSPDSSDIDKIKRAITPIAAKYRLRGVYIFGSYARNEATEDSDVDILIDREGSDVRGLFGMNALLNEFKDALKKDVDLVTLQSLRQKSNAEEKGDFIKNIMRERVKIYGEQG